MPWIVLVDFDAFDGLLLGYPQFENAAMTGIVHHILEVRTFVLWWVI